MLAAALILSIAGDVGPGPQLEAGIFAARPVVLSTGQLLGPTLGASWAFEDWALGLRARLGFAGENDLAFAVDHMELRALGTWRWSQRIGRGELGLGVGAGVVVLREARTRHQADRLAASGLPLSSSGTGVGPIFGLEASVSVRVTSGISLVVEGGPLLSWVSVADEGMRLGWSGGLGLRKSFGDDAESATR